MTDDAIQRALDRVGPAATGRADAAVADATIERARAQVEALAATAAELETALPQRVGEAVRDGVRAEALPVARHVAEVRGLTNAVLRRLERLEGDLLAERNARVADLDVLVDLIASGWRSVDERLGRLEAALDRREPAALYQIDERRPAAAESS